MITPMRVALSVFLGVLLCAMGCNQKGKDHPPILAKVGDTTITTAELKAKFAIHAKSAFIATRYSQPKDKRALLDEMIQESALAQEARRRGYDKDPLVLREMVNRMFEGEIDAKAANEVITEGDIEKYYYEHASDYSRPDRVQVAQILIKDQAKANQVSKEARRLKSTDTEGFKQLVLKYSEEPTTRETGGDLGFLEHGSPKVPKEVINAAFALPNLGSVSNPIQTPNGFVILRLLYNQPGVKTTPATLAVIRPNIKHRIANERNRLKRSQLIAEILKQTKIEVSEEGLEKVDFK